MNPAGKRRILIVDDDPGIRRLLVIFLRRRGFQMLEARDGREALAEMRTGNVDLVLMDLMMPEVTGWDVLRERAADPGLQRIPMIIVTANDRGLQQTDELLGNVQAVLAKPFDLNVLLTTVATCLEHPRSPVLAAA